MVTHSKCESFSEQRVKKTKCYNINQRQKNLPNHSKNREGISKVWLIIKMCLQGMIDGVS